MDPAPSSTEVHDDLRREQVDRLDKYLNSYKKTYTGTYNCTDPIEDWLVEEDMISEDLRSLTPGGMIDMLSSISWRKRIYNQSEHSSNITPVGELVEAWFAIPETYLEDDLPFERDPYLGLEWREQGSTQ